MSSSFRPHARSVAPAERLVHGPLTALMMLEAATTGFPGLRPRVFEYRAHNPMVVGRKMTIHAAWEDGQKTSLRLWAVDDGEQPVVGMKGRIVF